MFGVSEVEEFGTARPGYRLRDHPLSIRFFDLPEEKPETRSVATKPPDTAKPRKIQLIFDDTTSLVARRGIT